MGGLRCLLCPATLGPKERWEHPVLNALGGRLKSRKLICTKCNERLGGEIDKPLTKALETIRHVLRVRSGSGDDSPTLRGVQTEHGIVDIGPADGFIRPPRPSVRSASPELTEFQVHGRTIEEAARTTAHMARSLKIKTREELIRRIKLPANMHISKQPITKPVRLDMPLGDVMHMRSIAKTALGVFGRAFPTGRPC